MRIVLLSSLQSTGFAAVASALGGAAGERHGDTVLLDLTRDAVHPCLACGRCNRTGRCILRDEMTEILPKIASCDLLVLATPIAFGVHDPVMKRAVDRFLPLAGERFAIRHGEMHHAPRHSKRFDLLGIGRLEASVAPEEGETFERLIGRHAVNLACSRHATVLLQEDVQVKRTVRDGLARLGVEP